MPTTTLTRRAAAVVAALALAAVPAGCGGDDEENGATAGGEATPAQTPEETPAETPAGTPTETPEGTAEGGDADQGRQLFVSACGSCHTLEDAGTTGTIGPNLDELDPSEEQVLQAIETGPGAMPENLYQGEQAQQVAEYVATAAGP